MTNFCTLFNSAYLTRGVALYESLERNCVDFHLYIFAFDDKCYDVLKEMDLASATVVSMDEFEDETLLSVKKERDKGEYCWTCTSSVILFSIKKFGLESCTFLDSDLYFFSDPKILIEEMEENSVSIIEHRYTEGIKIDWISKRIEVGEMEKRILSGVSQDDKRFLLDFYEKDLDLYKLKEDFSTEEKIRIRDILHSAGHNLFSDFGKYCVQFMTFKNDKNGMEVLENWRNDCINWCYAKVEDGKFGDQKYLENWEKKYKGIISLRNLGGGVAPWNIKQYDFVLKTGKIIGKEKKTGREFALIFYHFAALRFFRVIYKLFNITLFMRKRVQYANEDFGGMNEDEIKLIYRPYMAHMEKIRKRIAEIDRTIDPVGFYRQYKFFENLFLKNKRRIET
jgi:hypothetical protein